MRTVRILLVGALLGSSLFFSACKKDKPEPQSPQPDVVITTFTSHGKGGETITITGSGFSATKTENIVKVNGASATVTEATTTSLTATIPAKAGSGFISVQVKTKTATSTNNFIYDWMANVTTFASSTTFGSPVGAAVDASGNVYVAEYGAHKIRKITPAGVVTTLAGSGTAGSVDGTGTAAQFNGPTGVAVDVNGNVYVAESGAHKIRKIAPAGVVTTLAGSGTAGFADGTGTAAQFNTPFNLALDASGNVYVAESGAHKIRKITPAGVVTTLAGSGTAGFADGTGTAAQFNTPTDLALDASGNVYVADYSNHRIRKITPNGMVTTLAGDGTADSVDGSISEARFKSPSGIGMDATGNIYVTDIGNYKVRMIMPAGIVVTLAGDGQGSADGIGSAAKFSEIYDVVPDNNGNLYVPDYGNSKIRKIILE